MQIRIIIKTRRKMYSDELVNLMRTIDEFLAEYPDLAVTIDNEWDYIISEE